MSDKSGCEETDSHDNDEGRARTYRPVSTLTAERRQHKQHWDRLRQREHRAQKNRRLDELMVRVEQLSTSLQESESKQQELSRALQEKDKRLLAVEQERDGLRAIISKAFLAAGSLSSGSQSSLSSQSGDGPFSALSAPMWSTPSVPHDNNCADFSNSDMTNAENHNHLDGTASLVDPSFGFGTASLDASIFNSVLTELDTNNTHLNPHNSASLVGEEGSWIQARQGPQWSAMPLNTAPMCVLDSTFAELESTYCQLWARGNMSIRSELDTPAFPSISSLLNPKTTTNLTRNVNKVDQFVPALVVQKIMSQMPVHDRLKQLAALWVICVLLRWRLCRDKRSFEALPPFLRPTQLQLQVPHPTWVDTLVFPDLRDRIIQQFDYGWFNEFRRDLGLSLSIGWDRGLLDAVTAVDEKSEASLSVAFTQWLSNEDNWTVSADLATKWPLIVGTVRTRC